MSNSTKKTTPAKTKALAEKPVSQPVPAPPAKAEEPQKKRTATHHVLDRMVRVMRARGSDYPTDAEQDFGVQMLANLKPEGPAEVMLCSQMIATWEVGMSMLTASKQATDFESLEAQGNLAVKLMSLFERQFATLTKARKPAGRDRRPALLSQNAPRDTLPVASNEARPVPNARRRTRDRRRPGMKSELNEMRRAQGRARLALSTYPRTRGANPWNNDHATDHDFSTRPPGVDPQRNTHTLG